jgi:hypothetical protein
MRCFRLRSESPASGGRREKGELIMKQGIAIALFAVALSGCGQNAGNEANNAATNAGAPAANATNTAASAPAPAAPETGPVTLASDSSLPAPCQTVVRETQACIDNLTGDQAAFRQDWLRSSLTSSRSTWASAADDSYRGPVCEQDLETLRRRVATWNCAAR